MSRTFWLRNWRTNSKPLTAKTAGRSSRRRPLLLERLEDRCVLSYTPIDLGSFNDPAGLYAPVAINNFGQVVGSAAGHAALWVNGAVTDLGTLPGGLKSGATDINDNGQVVGWSDIATVRHAFLWTPANPNGTTGAMTALGVMTDLGGNVFGGSVAINNVGVVVGYRETRVDSVKFSASVIWEDGAEIDLASRLPLNSGWTNLRASDVNDRGQITGAGTINGATRAFVYTDTDGDGLFSTGTGQIVSLGTLGGVYISEAAAINNGGQVAGYASTTQGELHAFRWTPSSPNGATGAMKDLGRLQNGYGQDGLSIAYDLNDSGDVVGFSWANSYSGHAVISTGGTKVQDLNGQIPSNSGWQLSTAYGINNAGWIVGRGSNGNLGGSGFLLIPGTIATPLLSISDATVTEGDTGTVPANFTVTLSAPSLLPVTVDVVIRDGDNGGVIGTTAGTDYEVPASMTLNFLPGVTSMPITVQVKGDTIPEYTETFLVTLSNPTNALFADSQGRGTILDDDSHLSINAVTVTEGNSGTTPAVFTVTLSKASTQPVTVAYTTRDSDAKAGSDYLAKSGTLTFNPGASLTQTITVSVNGDTVKEANENFSVDLSNASNAVIYVARGWGTILNDDKGGKALTAAGTPSIPVTEVLSQVEVQSLLSEAVARWQAAGVNTSRLGSINVQIADLGGATLGLTSGHTIWLDDNAAGWGWFVDATPWDDSEFTTPGNQGEQNRMDLLTVVMHELGHVLGQDHDDDGVMAESLAAGIRLAPGDAAADWLFAHSGADDNDWLSAVSTPGARRKAR